MLLGLRRGQRGRNTGFLKAISGDGSVTENGETFWAFRLRRMVDNNHWSTMERIYVNAQTGIVSTVAGK